VCHDAGGTGVSLRESDAPLRMPTAVASRPRTGGLPETGPWSFAPGLTRVAFSGRANRLVPMVRAEFTGVSGIFVVAEEPTDSEVEVLVEVATMTTGNDTYDDLLARLDPLEALQHPWATYHGALVQWDKRRGGRIAGTLTLRGVAHPVELDVHAITTQRYQASGEVDWRAFGIAYHLPGAGLLAPKTMRLDIDITAVRAS
jgi:polyisoprenoid-binding protein YceI